MQLSIAFIIYGVVAVVLLLVGQYVGERLIKRVKRKRAGCELPPFAPSGFAGIPAIRRVLKADKEWTLPDFFALRYNELTAHFGRPAATFWMTIFDKDIIHTSDPVNLKALLATQFEDFCLGNLRQSTMSPTLGSGIVGLLFPLLREERLIRSFSSLKMARHGRTLVQCSE